MDKSIGDAHMLAALDTLRDTFAAIKPLYEDVSRLARAENSMGLAFSAEHLIASTDVFYGELEKFVMELAKK
jgi:hypothetical protein